jgi:hypothetical protein
MRRELETESRRVLHGHEGGNPGDGQGRSCRVTAPVPDPTRFRIVLRSKTSDLVKQEFYGLLLAHFAVRGLMHEAALESDQDPDRLSFLHAVRVVRRKIAAFASIPPSGQEEVP